MKEIHVMFKSPNEVLDFINRIDKYPYDMDLMRGSIVVDAKSLLGIMNLGFNQIVSLKVYAEECPALCQDIEPYIAA